MRVSAFHEVRRRPWCLAGPRQGPGQTKRRKRHHAVERAQVISPCSARANGTEDMVRGGKMTVDGNDYGSAVRDGSS